MSTSEPIILGDIRRGPDGSAMVFTDIAKGISLCSTAQRCNEAGLYSDVDLVVDGTHFKCHRVVLASMSDYFPPLFENDDAEVSMDEVKGTATDFNTILKFGYMGEIELSIENVQGIYFMAKLFDMPFITQSCIRFMLEYLTTPEAFVLTFGEERYATDSRIGPVDGPPQFELSDPEIEIKRIEIYIRRWDGRPVLGGMAVYYRRMLDEENTTIEKFSTKGGMENMEKHEVELEPQEKITAVNINSGWMVDSIGFVTNKKRTIGPFGGPGGGEHTVAAPPGKVSFLYDIACDEVVTQGELGLHNLMLRWLTFN